MRRHHAVLSLALITCAGVSLPFALHAQEEPAPVAKEVADKAAAALYAALHSGDLKAAEALLTRKALGVLRAQGKSLADLSRKVRSAPAQRGDFLSAWAKRVVPGPKGAYQVDLRLPRKPKSGSPKAKLSEAELVKIHVARSHLGALKAALANYKSDMGRYPRLAPRPASSKADQADAAMADDAPALYAAIMNRPTLATGGGPNTPYVDGWKPAFIGFVNPKHLVADALASGGKGTKPLPKGDQKRITDLDYQKQHSPQSKDPLVFLDPWGNPFHYREWASVRTSIKDSLVTGPRVRVVQDKAGKRKIPDRPHSAESFDLWSNGPNGLNEYGDPDSDDVVSWR